MQTHLTRAAEAVGALPNIEGHDAHDSDALISASAGRSLAGGISAMTEWRWRRAGLLPEPIHIRGRNYYRRGEFMRALRNLGTSTTA